MRLIFLAAVLLLAGCAADAPPNIQTHDVNIAVAQPCTVDTKNQRPMLLTREKLWDQLSMMPSSDAKTKAVTDQLLAYMGWLPVVEDAMKGCESRPGGETSPRPAATPR